MLVKAEDRFTAAVVGETPCSHPDCEEVLDAGSTAFRAKWETHLVFCSRECRLRDQARRKQHRLRNDPATAEKQRAYEREVKLRNKYGITPADWDALHDAQLGRCAICLATLAEVAKVCVDHDHETGEVRGLLCNGCNRGLGYFKDDPDRLKRAAEYLDA